MSDSYSEIYRPKKPAQLIGETQRNTAEKLLKNVAEGKIIQEVLFSGDSGIGKTTIAKMYISAVLGAPYERQPFNCGDKTGVDYIREEVIGTMNYLSLESKYRVYFLDEIHMLSTQAQNSLLVAIEPVPKHVLMICCTTQPEKLIPTLRSRLTEYHLTPPNLDNFRTLAEWICGNQTKIKRASGEMREDEKVTVPNNLRDEVIGLAGGNVRQFVRFFQQVLDGSYTGVESMIQRQENLARMLMLNNTSLSDLFKAIDPSTDYVKEAIGLSRYAVAILKNPQSNTQTIKAAKAVLKVFGVSPSRQIDGDTTFFAKLLEVYESRGL